MDTQKFEQYARMAAIALLALGCILVVRPFIAGMHEMSPDVRRRAVRTQEIPLQSRWPIRLMSFEAKAGYYSHHWGYLPWSLSRSPFETIEIFEVRAPAPPPSPDPCASS